MLVHRPSLVLVNNTPSRAHVPSVTCEAPSLSLCLAPRIASANPNPGIPPGPASARSETQTRTPTPQPHERPRARGTYACEIPIGFVEQHGACLQSQTRAGVAPAPVRSAPSAPSPLDSSCPISRAEIPSTARLNPPAKFRAASAVPRSAIGSITPMWTLIVDPLGSVEPLCTWLCHFPQHLCPAAPPPPPLLLPAHLACLGTWLVPGVPHACARNIQHGRSKMRESVQESATSSLVTSADLSACQHASICQDLSHARVSALSRAHSRQSESAYMPRPVEYDHHDSL